MDFCACDVCAAKALKIFSRRRNLIKRGQPRRANTEVRNAMGVKSANTPGGEEKMVAGKGRQGGWEGRTPFGVTWVLLLQGMRRFNLSLSGSHRRINICMCYSSRQEARMEGEIDEEVLP